MYFKLHAVALCFFLASSSNATQTFIGIKPMHKKSGIFLAQDQFSNPIILEWEEVRSQTDRLPEIIKSVSNVLVEAYTQTEVTFARTKPQEVAQDFMLKSLAPLLEQSTTVDWQIFEQKTNELLQQFFETTDWKKHSAASDTFIFVVAKDADSKEILGVQQFIISHEFPAQNVKAALSGLTAPAQNRGIEKLLMSTIFKLQPDVERIFLHTRSTNQKAIDAYKVWGFTEFEGKLPHWTDLEYRVKHSDILQKVSKSLID